MYNYLKYLFLKDFTKINIAILFKFKTYLVKKKSINTFALDNKNKVAIILK